MREELFIIAIADCSAVECHQIVGCRLTHATFSHDPILVTFALLAADQIARMDTLDILCRILRILGVHEIKSDASHIAD